MEDQGQHEDYHHCCDYHKSMMELGLFRVVATFIDTSTWGDGLMTVGEIMAKSSPVEAAALLLMAAVVEASVLDAQSGGNMRKIGVSVSQEMLEMANDVKIVLATHLCTLHNLRVAGVEIDPGDTNF